MKNILKSLLTNLINDRIEEANVDFHSYLTSKMAQVAGIADVDEAVKSVEQLKGLTQNLSKTTNKYRALKTPGALKGVQRAEDKIERELGQK